MTKHEDIARTFADSDAVKLEYDGRFVAERTKSGIIIRRPTAGTWNRKDTAIDNVTRGLITIIVGRGWHREALVADHTDLWVRG